MKALGLWENGDGMLQTIGDSLRDHVELYGADAACLRDQVCSDPAWGTSRIVLPNASYGQWQRGYK